MDDEEYFELARLIRNHLLDLDLDDIADFSNYTDDEGDERSLPDGRTLMKLMLASFDPRFGSCGRWTAVSRGRFQPAGAGRGGGSQG